MRPTPPFAASARHHRAARRAGVVVATLLLAGVLAFALTHVDLARTGRALVSASLGWLVLALVLMMASLLMRAVSWHAVLRAALPGSAIPWRAVIRATMIGVMGSAVFPGRVGEPTRMLVLSRRIQGPALPTARVFPVVAGTVFSQTLINLVALGILAAVTFSSVSLFQGNASTAEAVLALPAFVALFVFGTPFVLRLAQRSRSRRVRSAATAFAGLLRLAQRGLAVFARPRFGVPAVGFQLLAWALQWGSCYAVILALGLQHHGHTTPVTAAAVLLAVNVTAVLPATPSNVGVFQAACLVVLAAYGIGAGQALAYGVLLQAVELLTALALGVPALLREGMTWRDIRRESARVEESAAREESLSAQ